MNNSKFYTYVLLDPRKQGQYTYNNFISFLFKPFYIGKGSFERCYQHTKETEKTTYNPHKFYTIQKIKNNGLAPIVIKLNENLDEQEANRLEKLYIQIIGRSDLKLGPLTNLTDGGEGTSGRKATQEQKLSASKARKGKPSPRKGLPYKHPDIDLNMIVFCKCGCGKQLIPVYTWKYDGIPEYEHGHIAKGKSRYPDVDLSVVVFCKCGCGEQIVPKRSWGWNGIPDYKNGHTVRCKKVVNAYPDIDLNMIVFCKCGCGKQLTPIKEWKWNGIPTFIKNHHRKKPSTLTA